MGLDTVLENIQKNAKQAADAALQEAKDHESRLMAEAKDRLAALRTAEQQHVEQELMAIKSQLSVRKELSERVSILLTKKQAMDAVYDAFEKQLTTGAARGRLFTKLVSTAKAAMSKPGAVYVDAADVAHAKKAFPQATVKTQTMRGGLVAESKDEKQLVDLRLETIIDVLRSRIDARVAEALFSEKKVMKKK
ncbi:MAG: V-type ATP synthase subunit E [Nanoarchaeota archaeon]|nr:V-type ATP synthase subunit E [Nanoarchaeota archaeon]